MILIVNKNIQDVDKKGQYSSFYFRSSPSDIRQFKKVYFENSFIDEVKANKDFKQHEKKIFFLSAGDIAILINLTDREFKRDKRVSSILKSAKPLSFFLNQDSIVKINNHTDKLIKEHEDNKHKIDYDIEKHIVAISRQLFKKTSLKHEDKRKEALHLLKISQTAPKDSIVLNVNKRVSEATNKILNVFKTNNSIILNAPTGSGKSYFSLEVLRNHFKKILIISPYRMLTNEHAHNINWFNYSNADNQNALLANLMSNPYIAMTTDVLVNLHEKNPLDFKSLLGECELVIWDEQHIIESSKGFRNKVLKANKLIKKADTKILYLSGTPTYDENENGKSVVIKTPLLYTIRYFNNIFGSVDTLRDSISKHLEKGSVLFYCSTKLKVDEVANALPSFKNVCTITSEQTTYNGNVITDINQIPKDDKVLYISTTRITTGVNINGLKATYQYGTAYDTTTKIQLIARLREEGDFYYIKPKFENNQMSNIIDTAIGLAEHFAEAKIKSVQKDFYSKEFQTLIKSNNIALSDNTPKGFLKEYHHVFKKMSGVDCGKLTLDGSDFIPNTNMNKEAIQTAFMSSEDIEFKRDTDKTIVNFMSGENIEHLNDIYNLSFAIQLQKNVTSFNAGLEIITDEDKSVKVEKNREKKSELDTLHDTLCERFEYITPKLLKNTFTNQTEIKRLINADINHKAIKDIVREDDRLTALRCYLVKKVDVFDTIFEKMIKNDSHHVSLKEISKRLSQLFINPTKRTKDPYSQFLKDILTSDSFNNSMYEFKDIVKIDKTTIRNVIRVKKEHLNAFNILRDEAKAKLLIESQAKEKAKAKLLIESYIRQGKVVVEDIDTNEVIETSNAPEPTMPTETYINELQGAYFYFNNNKNNSIPIDKVPKDYSNLIDKRVRYKNFNNVMNL